MKAKLTIFAMLLFAFVMVPAGADYHNEEKEDRGSDKWVQNQLEKQRRNLGKLLSGCIPGVGLGCGKALSDHTDGGLEQLKETSEDVLKDSDEW